MKVLLFGGTGFIGKHLIPLLIREEYEIILFTRNQDSVPPFFRGKVNIVEWSLSNDKAITGHMTGDYAIINLAGESIGAKYWTKKQKDKIRSSRVNISMAIADAIRNSSVKPLVILQGSAIGYYGSQSDTILNEESVKGKGFLADVVEDWESSLTSLSEINTRIAFLRTAVVIGIDGGILPKLLLPFKYYLGGHMGNGEQWFSWIHITDLVDAMLFLLKSNNTGGIYNLTSPEPVKMKEFSRIASELLEKPSWLHIPAFVLRLINREMAENLFLTSQRVISVRLMEAGFPFKYVTAEMALENLIKKT
jgi:uncharacterized protein (TIGR01777 family)